MLIRLPTASSSRAWINLPSSDTSAGCLRICRQSSTEISQEPKTHAGKNDWKRFCGFLSFLKNCVLFPKGRKSPCWQKSEDFPSLIVLQHLDCFWSTNKAIPLPPTAFGHWTALLFLVKTNLVAGSKQRGGGKQLWEGVFASKNQTGFSDDFLEHWESQEWTQKEKRREANSTPAMKRPGKDSDFSQEQPEPLPKTRVWPSLGWPQFGFVGICFFFFNKLPDFETIPDPQELQLLLKVHLLSKTWKRSLQNQMLDLTIEFWQERNESANVNWKNFFSLIWPFKNFKSASDGSNFACASPTASHTPRPVYSLSHLHLLPLVS